MPYRAEDTFASVADPNRRRIISLLARHPYTIVGLAEHFEMSPQGMAKHLQVLKNAGVVAAGRRGREVVHWLNPDGLKPLTDWLLAVDQAWDKRLTNLRILLEEEKECTES